MCLPIASKQRSASRIEGRGKNKLFKDDFCCEDRKSKEGSTLPLKCVLKQSRLKMHENCIKHENK